MRATPLRPGLASCAALTPEQQSNRRAKFDCIELLAGLHPGQSARSIARGYGIGESTLRGWLHLDALDRRPPPEFLKQLRALAAWDDWKAQA